MIAPQSFVDALYGHGFTTLTSVPCSFFTYLINSALNDRRFRFLMANNEGESLALASGLHLAGKKSCVMIQNSGFGNLVNPLTSLNYPYQIPILLLITWRGQPGVKDEPQHGLMGQTLRQALDMWKVPNEVVPQDEAGAVELLKRADKTMKETQLPFALILPKDTFSSCQLNPQPPHSRSKAAPVYEEEGEVTLMRKDALEAVAKLTGKEALVITTTGKTSREYYSHFDAPNNLYVVGSMGCTSSIGLGVALGAEGKKVCVVDGDGAALMRMEALVSIGHYRPKNFVHIVLDNGVHDSTGGQVTLSNGVRLGQVASACGYETVAELTRLDSFKTQLSRSLKEPGPHFIRLKTRPGSPPDLPRPSLTPAQVKDRFMQFAQGH